MNFLDQARRRSRLMSACTKKRDSPLRDCNMKPSMSSRVGRFSFSLEVEEPAEEPALVRSAGERKDRPEGEEKSSLR